MRTPENRPPEHNANRPVKQSRTPMMGIVAVAVLVIIVLVWWIGGSSNTGTQTQGTTGGTTTGTQMDGQTQAPAGGTAPTTGTTTQQAPADTAPAPLD